MPKQTSANINYKGLFLEKVRQNYQSLILGFLVFLVGLSVIVKLFYAPKQKLPAEKKAVTTKQEKLETQANKYKVKEGDIFNVEKVETKGKERTMDKVLMAVDGDKVKVGKPVLNDVKVIAEVIGEVKGEKIRVFRYRKTEQYRKTIGHRQQYTRLKITKIEV